LLASATSPACNGPLFSLPEKNYKFIDRLKTVMQKLPVLLFLTLFISCSSDQMSNAEKPPKTVTTFTYPIHSLIIDNGEEEGWGADIRLSLIEVASADSFTTYKAISSHEEKNVGIEFILPYTRSAIESSPTQMLEIRTCGESSDNLLMLLSKLYKLKDDPTRHFIHSAELAFVDLNEFAKSKFGKEAIRHSDAKEMKLFFQTDYPDDYAELYLNINDKEHWLELKEKDEGYREQIIKFLTAK